MVIGCDHELTVGAIDVGLTDIHAAPHATQPFRVLRVATRAEWFAEAEADGMSVSLQQRTIANSPGAHFYEVSVD